MKEQIDSSIVGFSWTSHPPLEETFPASLGVLMPSEAFEELGSFLTASEAVGLASLLAEGEHTSTALREISQARRGEVKALLSKTGLGHTDAGRSVAVLRAIAGAKSIQQDLTPVWTMPGNEASTGHLTSEFHRLVASARQSVTCASYNFEETSQMWTVLQEVTEQPGVVVTVYVDSNVANAERLSHELQRATIYKSSVLPSGSHIVSHAKFIIVDHAVLLITSANFSYSAENKNIEFGLLIHDSALAESVEATMASKHGSLYELV